MRFTPLAATSVFALGTLLGGVTAFSDAGATQTVQQRTVASDLPAEAVAGLRNNHGND